MQCTNQSRWQHSHDYALDLSVAEPENQFSLTRAALSKHGREKSKFLSVVAAALLPLFAAPVFAAQLIPAEMNEKVAAFLKEHSAL